MKRTDRWALFAGWLGIFLIIAGGVAIEVVGYPSSGASLSEYGASYTDDTRRAVLGLNWLFTTSGGLLLLWLIATLHSHLRAHGATETGALLFLVFGFMVVLLLLADVAVDQGYSGSSYFDSFKFNEQTAPIGIALNEVRFALEVQSVIFGAAMLFAGSVLLGGLSAVSPWLSRAGYLLGVLVLVIAIPLESLGVLIVLLWLGITSSLLLRTGAVEV
jgi:hypothetical protein